MMYDITKTKFNGLYIIKQKKFIDSRGYLIKTFEKELLSKSDISISPFEAIETKSKKNVVRGLHYQINNSQAKLVRVSKGEIIDIVVDLRENSDTFKNFFTYKLNDLDNEMLYVPKGFAHGYITISNESIVNYLADNKYDPEYEFGIKINKEMLLNYHIKFDELIFSEKDYNLIELENVKVFFDGRNLWI